MKHLFIFLFLIFSIGCTAENGDRQRTRKILEEAQKQIGMPEIINFQEKKLAKIVMELRDREDLICYVYIKSDYQGTLHFVGKSIGYGIPYGLSLTNPEQRNGISQAEPNALYTNGATTSATWLFMIDPKSGEPKPIYFEPEIVVSPFPLH